MTKEQSQKVVYDFQYLIGRIVDYIPDKPTITHLSSEKDLSGKYFVRVHAINPHPSIPNGSNEFIQVYCKKVGIEYDFPDSL